MFTTIAKSLTVTVVAGMAAMLASTIFAPTAAWAQAGYGGGRGGTQQGGFQQGGYQQGGYQQGGFQQGGFGQQQGAFGQQSGFGAGGAQQGAFGAAGSVFGNTGFGTQQGGAFGQSGNGMMGGFGQQGANGQRNFIGRDSLAAQSTLQGLFGAPQQGRQNGNRNIQNINDQREQRRRWRDQQNAPPPIKVQLRPAFDLAPSLASTGEVQSATQSRLDDVLVTHNLGPVGSTQVTVDQGVTVLTGVVRTAHARALIARLVSLEPGVGQVDNRLTVAASDAESSAPGGTP